MITAAVQESVATQQKKRRQLTIIVMATIVGTIVTFYGIGKWIVATFYKEPEAVFVASPRAVKIPPKQRQHSMQMAKHQAMAPKPTLQRQLISTRPTTVSLPDMPMIDLNEMLQIDPSEVISDQTSSLVGSAGLWSGAGAGLSGMGGTGKGLGFFGVETNGERILLLFDVSQSVVNKASASGLPMARIKQETLALIAKMPVQSRFNVIQFVRNFKPYQPELVIASKASREAATVWTETEWQETGQMPKNGAGVISETPNGILSVIDAAYKMKPDVMFLISDGSFQQTGAEEETVPHDDIETKIKAHEKEAGKIPIHFLSFKMDEKDADFWKKMTRHTGGTLKELKGEDDFKAQKDPRTLLPPKP